MIQSERKANTSINQRQKQGNAWGQVDSWLVFVVLPSSNWLRIERGANTGSSQTKMMSATFCPSLSGSSIFPISLSRRALQTRGKQCHVAWRPRIHWAAVGWPQSHVTHESYHWSRWASFTLGAWAKQSQLSNSIKSKSGNSHGSNLKLNLLYFSQILSVSNGLISNRAWTRSTTGTPLSQGAWERTVNWKTPLLLDPYLLSGTHSWTTSLPCQTSLNLGPLGKCGLHCLPSHCLPHAQGRMVRLRS